ncbi:protein FAM166C A [Megalops cyprinoides]|uniref:protein FAM166C A n=1 Tax=Megalops cyprinoides TaxID=118141 RepID=UPI001864C4C2|nr:protein FAM166C A [Megalops cyprinoides]
MAYRSVGTFVTPNNPTYIVPSLMPGYCGHVPTVKLEYGDTFGNASMKHFRNIRSAAMETSTSPFRRNLFPSIYPSNPMLLASYKSRSRDKGAYSPYWARHNRDFVRQEEIKRFDTLAQSHRQQYKDTSGTRKPVNYFAMTPNRREKY